MGQKIALVLSGGGARGIAHIGAIEELEAQGYEISSIAGTSMGALIGGIYAIGKLKEYKEWLYTLDRIKVLKLMDFSFSMQGLIKGDKLFKVLHEIVPDKNIEDLPIPFAAVATDIQNKKEVVFTKGSVADAVRASIAIPTIFTPVVKKGAVLVDGGIVNNIPVNRVKRTSGDKLVVVQANADIPVPKEDSLKEEKEDESVYESKLQEFYNYIKEVSPFKKDLSATEEKMGYFDVINKTMNMLINKVAEEMMKSYSPDVLIEVSREACGIFDFYKAEQQVERGRLAARRVLQRKR